MNTSKRKIYAPAIYKHFKNNLYATIGFSEPRTKEELANLSRNDYYAKGIWHTEKEGWITFLISKKINSITNCPRIFHSMNVSNETLVIYTGVTKPVDKYYARPLLMFASKVDFEKYPGATQEYRFEEIYDPSELESVSVQV